MRETENEHVINSRSYSMIMSNGMERNSMRTGEKVPFSSGSGGMTEWQQIDVGVNIDCRKLEDLGDRVALDVSAEVSSVVENQGGNSSPSPRPIIRSNRWDSRVLLAQKQPTILFSSDDPASKRKMQLQLTVTPVR